MRASDYVGIYVLTTATINHDQTIFAINYFLVVSIFALLSNK